MDLNFSTFFLYNLCYNKTLSDLFFVFEHKISCNNEIGIRKKVTDYKKE